MSVLTVPFKKKEVRMTQFSLALSGLGGQGIMTVSQILAAAAGREGVRVLLFEGTGISQRGGGVFGFVRLGDFSNPKIPLNGAEALISLELSEVASIFAFLKPGGEVWINAARIPGYYSKLRPELYPPEGKILDLIRLKTPRVRFIPADRLAREAGSAQAVNMAMLGAFIRRNPLFSKESLIWAIEESNKKFAEKNTNAFRRGFDFVQTEETPE
ncbi:MAG: hypothetical protein FJY82_02915 [Candidatus Aminicenantes bacterium]|nr:hypothetical protein [Candidatus Aminicenantes bacterium]